MLDSEIGGFEGKPDLWFHVVVKNSLFFLIRYFFFQELRSTAQETHQPFKVKLEAT